MTQENMIKQYCYESIPYLIVANYLLDGNVYLDPGFIYHTIFLETPNGNAKIRTHGSAQTLMQNVHRAARLTYASMIDRIEKVPELKGSINLDFEPDNALLICSSMINICRSSIHDTKIINNYCFLDALISMIARTADLGTLAYNTHDTVNKTLFNNTLGCMLTAKDIITNNIKKDIDEKLRDTIVLYSPYPNNPNGNACLEYSEHCSNVIESVFFGNRAQNIKNDSNIERISGKIWGEIDLEQMFKE